MMGPCRLVESKRLASNWKSKKFEAEAKDCPGFGDSAAEHFTL